MGILDVLKKKKEEPYEEPSPRSDFPNELEQFRLPPPRIEERPSPFEKKPEPAREKSFLPPDIEARQIASGGTDKIDLILSKLETIDARLRLIEEKLK